MSKLLQIYYKLFAEYGPQSWWPVTEKGSSKPIYKKRNKLNPNQRFEIIIGTILTQNTSWKNVDKTIQELHKKKLMSLKELKKVPHSKLAGYIRSSGYFNQKAKKIMAMIEFLESGKEVNRENLLGIWGVGPETADSILLYAYNKPVFVIDAYTKRILTRLGLAKKNVSYHELQELFHRNLPKNAELFNEYHALLVEHAKRYCRTKPLCNECIIKKHCKHSQNTKTL